MPSGTHVGHRPPPDSTRTRRVLLRTLFSTVVVAGTAAALAPVVRAGRGPAGATAPGRGAPRATTPEARDEAGLDEMYRGRRIQVAATGAAGPPARTAVTAASPVLSSPAAFDIRIDGRPLHVMRRADGSYLSSVNHYESFPTLRDVARAAVDDLRGAQLSFSGAVHHI